MTNDPGAFSLEHIVHQRRWQVCREPFLHIVAHDVFTPDFYACLDRAYGDLLARGLSEKHDPAKFSRNISNYDVYSMSLSADTPAPFDVFISREWHDMLAGLFGIRATGDVNGGFHHHPQGSKTGQVHNDLNPGWFVDAADPFQVNVSRSELVCSYSTGRVIDSKLGVHETIRAIAVLYYLHNPPWQPGAGGETGLYSSHRQPVLEPTRAVTPINNSLLLFECRPNSFHSFLSNRNGPRNSMIMWLHRPVEDIVQRWGQNSIAHWVDGPKNQPA
jgi:hypothetical protein